MCRLAVTDHVRIGLGSPDVQVVRTDLLNEVRDVSSELLGILLGCMNVPFQKVFSLLSSYADFIFIFFFLPANTHGAYRSLY